MKNSFWQYDADVIGSIGAVLIIEPVFLGLMFFKIIDPTDIWSILFMLLLPIFASYVFLNPKTCARIYADEMGMVCRAYGKERWRITWWDIIDVRITEQEERDLRNRRHITKAFRMTCNVNGARTYIEIQITRRTRRILGEYCCREEFKDAFLYYKV